MAAAAKSLLRLLLVVLLLGLGGSTWAQGMPEARADRRSAFDKTNRPELLERARRDRDVAVVVGLRFDPRDVPAARAAAGSAARATGIANLQRALESKLQRFNTRAIRKMRHLPYMAMRVDEAGLAELLADPNVVSVEMDMLYRPSLNETPTITHAVDAWNAGYTGSGQVVAIVDTGVDAAHTFLAGKVVDEACFSSPLSSGRSLCPGGTAVETGAGTGAPCVSSAPGCYHGTHVAGIAAGYRGVLGTDAGGMAPDAGLMAIQVFQEICDPDCQIAASLSDIILALDHVYSQRATLNIASVNLSLGGGLFAYPCDNLSPAFTDAVNLLRGAGIATVAAAGNDGSPLLLGHPACISTVVSVGSVNKDGSVSSFSNSAAGLSLLAPGGNVLSSLPGGTFGYLSGTSMAAPHVAGAWATLKSAYPAAGVAEVLGALQASGVPITDSRNGLVKPEIQISEAAGVLLNVPPTVAITEPAGGAVFVAPASITLTATASDSDGTVSRVEFYALDVKIGEATSEPFTFTWTNVVPGVYSLTARAVDDQFGTGVSEPITVTVEPGTQRVNVAAQFNGGVATASSTFSGNFPAASVNNGERKGLNWGSGGGWNDATADSYPDWLQVTFSGVKTIEEIDVFTVQDNYSAPVEPTESMTFGGYGITSFDVQYWNGSAWVTVPGGSVSGNNLVWRKFGFTPVSTDRIRVLVNASLSRYSRLVEVEAYTGGDTQGNQPPSVSINQPADGATYVAPASITLSANASDPDGTIARVEYYAGSTKIGEAFAPPYEVVWAGVPAGAYALTARAYDDELVSTVSAPVNVVVTEPGQTRINVALQSKGGVASASSTYNAGYPAAAVNNGDRKGLGWGSGGGWNDATYGAYPDWVQVTFSGVQTIDEIDVFTLQDNYSAPVEPTEAMTFGSYGITAFDVQYWSGSAWVTVPGASVSGNNRVWRKFVFAAVSTDRIRVLVNAALQGNSRVVEVEAYTSGGAPGNQPPSVSISQPADGAAYVAPASITLSANATDPDGTIARVEYYAGSTKIGEATASPYEVVWADVPAGVYVLTARAYDDTATSTVSAPVNVVVSEPGETRTNVALQSNGGVASASSTYNAGYPAAAVNNGDRKGVGWGSGGGWNDATVVSYPDWLQVTFDGVHTIDEIDVFTIQDSYSAPVEPTETMTFGNYGVTAFDVQYWSGSAWVTVPGGSVTGNNRVWRKFVFAPVSTDRIRVLVNAALASYSRLVEVEAYASGGAPGNQPPSVSINQPADGAAYVAPASITLSANATDPDGTIARVEYYAGNVKIGEATASPYEVVWADVPAGVYVLTARAYDDALASTVSAPVNIVVTEPGGSRANVALQSNGGVASASSTYSGAFPAAAVNNGDRKGLGFGSGGGWNDATFGAYPDWVQVTFDGLKTIDEIDVFTLQDNYSAPAEPTETMTFGSYGITAFEVQYWDSSAWVTVPGGSVSGNNRVWRKFPFGAVNTDRIRVLVSGTSDGFSRAVEVEAWGY